MDHEEVEKITEQNRELSEKKATADPNSKSEGTAPPEQFTEDISEDESEELFDLLQEPAEEEEEVRKLQAKLGDGE